MVREISRTAQYGKPPAKEPEDIKTTKSIKQNQIRKTNILNIKRVPLSPYEDTPNPKLDYGNNLKTYDKFKIDNIPLRMVLENEYGETFLNDAKNLFIARVNKVLDVNKFEYFLNHHLLEFRYEALVSIGSIDDWDSKRFQSLYKDIFQKACSDTYLDYYRSELSGWIDHTEKDEALFVDCLMGVGKTYSIIKTLAINSDKSAVVFFPTNKLCREVVQKLKIEILKLNPELANKYQGVPVDRKSIV